MAANSQLFTGSKPIIGVIHLPPLPGYAGSPGLDGVLEKAATDQAALEGGGVDGVLVENFADRPFRLEARPETVAVMTRVVRELVLNASTAVVGVEILLNDPAASLAGAWSGEGLLRGTVSELGVRGQLSRVMDPIVLEEVEESLMQPVNAADETAASACLWADVGDTASLSGSLDVSFHVTDEEGALNRNAPVPVTSARAALTYPVSVFDGYMRARLGAMLEHESGLARGPWDGLVEDSRLSLSLVATAEIDAVRLFVLAENVLSTDSARVPGMDPGDLTFSAGLSWRFLD